MIPCKHLPDGCDHVSECQYFLSDQEIRLLLSDLCNDLFEAADLLENRLHLDFSFDNFYFLHYRKIKQMLFELNRDLSVITPEPYLKADRMAALKK